MKYFVIILCVTYFFLVIYDAKFSPKTYTQAQLEDYIHAAKQSCLEQMKIKGE